jgi:hypothetical protein
MNPVGEQYLQRAIERLSQSDPLLKLLQEVRLGRMKATDPGLRVITESWLQTYRQTLEGANGLDAVELRRLDPAPRLAVLIEAGMVQASHPAVSAVQGAFERAISDQQGRKS